MTPEQLKEAIFNEVNERDIYRWHGISKYNLDRFLVGPTVIELVTVLDQKKEYWLVLDDREDMFGLATKTMFERKDIGYLVGLYGSFIDTLDNM